MDIFIKRDVRSLKMRKKRKIRIVSFMLILSLAFGLTACKENQDATTES
jgi:ABC-type oligopeptide transport system substrate-binding subunit